jgi:hypothetical protein
LDAKATGLSKWEAGENATASAIDSSPKDVIICDWHYDKASETAVYFARKGFDVVACPWRKPDVALAQLEQIQKIRQEPNSDAASHALGMLQTTWCGFSAFARAYQAQHEGAAPEKNAAAQSADCFARLFKAIRDNQ